MNDKAEASQGSASSESDEEQSAWRGSMSAGEGGGRRAEHTSVAELTLLHGLLASYAPFCNNVQRLYHTMYILLYLL